MDCFRAGVGEWAVNIKDQLDYLDNKAIENPIKSLEAAVDSSRFPSDYEPALSHPLNRSVVKIRDSGAIDIFAATHQGIRIDPNQQVVNICTNSLLQHLGVLRSWVSRDAKMEVAGGIHLVNHAVITVDSRGDIVVSTNGNATVNARGNVIVRASGNIELKAGNEISLTAGSHIQFTAPRYDFA